MELHARAATAAEPPTDTPRLRVPRYVRLLSPILRFLLGTRLPLGPNRLVIIRGRKSGRLRPTPLAILRVDGRRFLWAPWGEVDWVRNLRAAGRATIVEGRGREEVTASELDADERDAFFRDVLAPYARGLPFGFLFVRIVDGVDLRHPSEMAVDRRVFELQPA